MQNVLNTLRVLEEVAVRQPVGVGTLARVLELPKSTVQRSLTTLRTANWIKPTDDAQTKWQITAKVLHLGYLTGEPNIRDLALPVMEQLREITDETVHLMVPEAGSAILIERLQTRKPVRIVLPIGIGLPLHASANGKAILAWSDQETVRLALERGLPSYTDTTITDLEALHQELAEIRRLGYSSNAGEWRSDIAAVAAPILNHNDVPIASISISTPSARMPDDLRARYGELVRDHVAQLGRVRSTA